MEKTERQKMADISMSELIELEKEAATSLDGIELNNKTMQRPQGNNPMLNVDASAKVVVSDNKLEANMCVFSPQFSGKDITVETMRQALKDEHVVYGIDEQLLEEIAANKLYDKIFTVASGYAAVDGENGRVNNLFDTDKKLVPRKLEDGSVDYRDLGLIVNVRVNDLICEIVPRNAGRGVYERIRSGDRSTSGQTSACTAGFEHGAFGRRHQAVRRRQRKPCI